MESPPQASPPPAARRRASRFKNAGADGRKPSAGGGPARRDGPDSTRERILKAAGRLLAEQGFQTASIRVIARHSGISPGAVYKHFPGKADLLFEVVKRAVLSIPLFAESAGQRGTAAALPRLISAYAEPELKQLRRLSIELHAASTRDRKVKRVLSQSNQRSIAHIADLIRRAQAAGRLDAALDPEMAARALSVFAMGLMHMETLLPQMVGDAAWREFVGGRIAKLIGMP